jgi:ABC-2 type transport system permease protein
MGLSFVDLLDKFHQTPTPMPVAELFYVTWYFWLILTLITPVITMRLFAQEKSSGTFETLMTTPVSDFEVVLAKFSAALFFYLVTWLPLLACNFIIRYYTSAPMAIDFGVLGTTFLGILLLGGLFISLGCLASAMTRSQVIAAILSLLASASLVLLANFAEKLPSQTSWHAQALAYFALSEQMHDFSRGVVDTRSVVFLTSSTLFFLFLTLRLVESRRWK